MRNNLADPMVGGLQPLTMIDFPGRIAAVVFLQGCNMRCQYCHNPTLIPDHLVAGSIWKDVVRFLEKRKGFVEGVVFSGGEPTIQPGLVDAVRQVRTMGFEVALHTNGSNGKVLRELLHGGLLSYVAMDFKAPPEKWEEIAGVALAIDDLEDCFKSLLEYGVPYEVRTTVHSALLSDEDLMEMARFLLERGMHNWVLQKFRPGKTLNPNLKPDNGTGFRPSFLLRLRSLLPELRARGAAAYDDANEEQELLQR